MEPLAWWRIIACASAIGGLFVVRHFARTPLLNILCMCIGVEVLYGMVQDQISVRLSRPYFTLAHPPIIGLDDPTLLGIVWGFMGSWWGGLFLGMSVGLTATVGPEPPLTARQLVRPIGCVLLAQLLATVVCGLSMAVNGTIAEVRLGGGFAELPAGEHLWLLVVGCAHFGSYTSAVLGAISVCVWTARTRRQLSRRATSVQPPAG